MSNEQSNAPPKKVGAKPSHIAYNVIETSQGKPFFNRIGGAWTHKDDKGLDIQLDSVPVHGRVCLRKCREVQTMDYEMQEHQKSDAPPLEQARGVRLERER